MGVHNQRLGTFGERLVADWYDRQGFVVLDRNWRVQGGELDLVVGRDGLVVFCEVKTRSHGRFGHPVEAVDARKLARLRRLAGAWLAEHGVAAREVRLDVAAVSGSRVQVVAGVG